MLNLSYKYTQEDNKLVYILGIDYYKYTEESVTSVIWHRFCRGYRLSGSGGIGLLAKRLGFLWRLC